MLLLTSVRVRWGPEIHGAVFYHRMKPKAEDLISLGFLESAGGPRKGCVDRVAPPRAWPESLIRKTGQTEVPQQFTFSLQ